MSRVILLTSDQADAVRGPSATDSQAMLMPTPLSDGRHVLGVEVLDDPAHAAHAEMLGALPQTDASAIAELLPRGRRFA